MPAILSLSRAGSDLWASGPEGLLRCRDGVTDTILQPQEQLYCSATADDLILVGGLPHGIAFSADSGAKWQAAYVDEVEEAFLCIAPDPAYLESGVILAGTAGSGILRADDRGRRWSSCNFGLENFDVLSITWAAPSKPGVWPVWNVVFAATEDGLYRSPNGGLGWRRCIGTHGVFVVATPSAPFQSDGLVMAGTEDSGLWRSCDGGRSFEPLSDAPQQVNALLSTRLGWFLGNNDGIYRSGDGQKWTRLPDSRPALTLLEDGNDLWVGTNDGIECLSFEDISV